MHASLRIAVIGAGPAGLMAAETLMSEGYEVDIYDAMPSFGRKFLMAGKSGLNITHAEDTAAFLSRYRDTGPHFETMVRDFDAAAITAWMSDLGIKAHTGPTGRVFPEMMKASPLLRAWLTRLQAGGARMFTRHRWQGWSVSGALQFDTPEGAREIDPDAAVLALGGASWKRLGSDGAWARHLEARGVSIAPFAPSNCGVLVNWSEHMQARFAGQPVKSAELSLKDTDGTTHVSRAEFVITDRGLESGAIYTLSAPLRRCLEKTGQAELQIDLLPDISQSNFSARLERQRGKQSWSSYLRKTVRLEGVKSALLHEFSDRSDFDRPDHLAQRIKALTIPITGLAPLDDAISTSGGVAWNSLDQSLMLTSIPGCFCAGEMIAWDAPTGGYLITACLATGRAAGRGAAAWLETKKRASFEARS